MKIAREGYPLIRGGGGCHDLGICVWLGGDRRYTGNMSRSQSPLFFAIRSVTIPTGEGLIVVSPADGKVVSIVDIKDDPKFG